MINIEGFYCLPECVGDGFFIKLTTVVVVCRVRQLRQSCIGTGCHPGHEWLPDWHETAEGSAEAVQERQQTLLILAHGPLPLPSSNASTARVSSPSSQGHHSKDSVGRRGGGDQMGSGLLPPKPPEEENLLQLSFYTFCCVAFLRCFFCLFCFFHVIWVGLSIFNVYDYLWLRLESVFHRRYSVSQYVESERPHPIAISLPSGQAGQVD